MMDKNVKDLFNFNELLLSDEMRERLSVASDLKLVAALARVIGCGIYLVDYEKPKILFMSDNISKWCGIAPDKIKCYDEYAKCIPDSDYKMLVEINDAVLKFLRDKPDDEILKTLVSYNFHLNDCLWHQYFTPVTVENGHVKVGLFILTVPSAQESGQIVMRRSGESDYYEYSLERHEWQFREGIVLTDLEKQVLWYSAQGLTVELISRTLCKSVDSIKTYKKRLFKKLNVTNISEALIFAMNNKLL